MVDLAQISVPLANRSDGDFIEARVEERLGEISEIALVLAFADHLGVQGEISKISRTEMEEAISANIISLKLFFDALFKSGKKIRQACIITYSGEAMTSRHPGFEVAIAGLEVMVKLYAAEQEKTHFSMIGLKNPLQPMRESEIAEAIASAVTMPTGVLLDGHGRSWQIVHNLGENVLKWSLHG